MHTRLNRDLAALNRMSTSELRIRYGQLFDESTTSGNRNWLLKRIAWRLQELAEGGLTERARKRAAELANDADLRITAPKRMEQLASHRTATVVRDRRIPPIGSVLRRTYKGQELQITVLPEGFLHDGRSYPSLTAVAKAITGTHCNGFAFFQLKAKEGV